MKSEDVKIGKFLNEELWKNGIKNPPHHIKITAKKNEKGVVFAELDGAPIAQVSKDKKIGKKKVEEIKPEPETKDTQKVKETKVEEKQDLKKEEPKKPVAEPKIDAKVETEPNHPKK